MKQLIVTLALAFGFTLGTAAEADAGRRGSKSSYKSSSKKSSRSSSYGRGTGSSQRSYRVKGYRKKNGTYVAPSRRTYSDGTQRNNYSTRGNYNPWTGKKGTKSAKR